MALRHQTAPQTVKIFLCLAGTAQHVDELVGHDGLDVGAGGRQILARVEVVRVLREILADGAGHGKPKVGVDVDLAHRQRGGLAKLLLGDAHRVGHLAAVFVDHLHELLGHGGRAVEHDGEAGKTAGDLLQDVKPQGRRHENALLVAGTLGGGELVSAVAGADGDGQGVAPGLLDELLHLLGAGVAGILGGDVDLVLHAGERTKLGLHDDAVVVGVLDDLAGDGDVLGEGLGAGVDHDGGEAAVDAGLAGLKIRAVVQVQGDGDVGALDDGGLHQLHKIGVVGVGAGALADLEDQRRVLFPGGLGDALDDLHVVHVESADGVAAVIGFFKHLGGGG